MITLTATNATNRILFVRCALGGVRSHFGKDGADEFVWSAYLAVQRGRIDQAVVALEKGGYEVEVTE